MPNLCEVINDLVEQRLRKAFETGQMVNVSDLASEITESLADLIVCSAPPEEQSPLMAHVVEELGRLIKEKARGWCGCAGAVSDLAGEQYSGYGLSRGLGLSGSDRWPLINPSFLAMRS
jgi:hypothetical protein